MLSKGQCCMMQPQASDEGMWVRICVCVGAGVGVGVCVAVDVGHLEMVITMNYKKKDSA